MLVVSHGCGHASRETSILEVKCQVLAHQLQLLEFLLLVVDLCSVGHNFLTELLIITRHLVDFSGEIVLIEPAKLLVECNLLIIVS